MNSVLNGCACVRPKFVLVVGHARLEADQHARLLPPVARGTVEEHGLNGNEVHCEASRGQRRTARASRRTGRRAQQQTRSARGRAPRTVLLEPGAVLGEW